MKKIKLTYIIIFIILTIGIATFSFSYAFFTNKIESSGKLNIVAGTLDYKIESSKLNNNKITVAPNSVEILNIKIISLNNVSSKYELYYILSNSNANNVTIGYTNKYDSSVGTIDSKESKTVEVIINNQSNSEQTIEFGVQGGLVNANFKLAQGSSLINDTTIPDIDIRIEKVDGKTYAKVEGYDELSGIEYITNGSQKQLFPKEQEPLKVLISKPTLGEDDKWYIDKTNYENAFYNSEVVVTDSVSSMADIINDGYDIVVNNYYAWSVPSNISILFDAGIHLISNGDDTASLTLISSSIRHVDVNYTYNIVPAVDNIFTKKFNLNRTSDSQGRNLIKFIDDVEVFFQGMVDGILYDEIGYYNKNGTKWIHSQVSPFKSKGAGDSDLTDFYKTAYEFIIEKNIAEFEITSTGDYTFEVVDNAGNKITKTIYIEI